MFLVESTTSFATLDREQLVGASVDAPTEHRVSNAAAVVIQGWALGRASRVRWVEAVADGRVLCRMRPTHDRPDVAAALGDMPGAGRSGFQGVVDAVRVTGSGFVVRAVLETGALAEIAQVRLHAFWLSGRHVAERNVASIVIPCFNQAPFLGDAIESALAQSHPQVEVVVVDDGSNDNAAEVAARYPVVKYIRQENAGLASARNAGLRASNGEYLLFLDADDRLRPDAVSASVACLVANPSWALVSGEHCYIGADGDALSSWVRPRVTDDHYRALLQMNYIGCPAAVLYRRAALHVARGFDARFHPCEDYDLALRLAREYPVGTHDVVMAEYRRYGGGMSGDSGRMLEAALGVLKAQRQFIAGDRRLGKAMTDGRRNWRELYGRPLALAARRDLASRGSRGRGLREVRQLLRLAPRQLARVMLFR